MRKPLSTIVKNKITIYFRAVPKCSYFGQNFEPMPIYRLSIPFVILLGLSIYLTITVSERWAIFIVFFVVLLIAGLVLAPLINWWWWERFPPDLPKSMHGLLEQRIPFYQQLETTAKREFRRRIFLFNQGTQFMPQGLDKIMEDTKLMIAVAPVSLSFNEDNFIFEQFENIVIYPHPFPSPQYPEQFHTSEIFIDDGVLLFSIQHIVKGFLEPQKYFNSSWYEYARIYLMTYPDKNYGDFSTASWSKLEQVSGFTIDALQKWVGFSELDKDAFTIAFYFLYPQAFKRVLPDLFNSLQLVFDTK